MEVESFVFTVKELNDYYSTSSFCLFNNCLLFIFFLRERFVILKKDIDAEYFIYVNNWNSEQHSPM